MSKPFVILDAGLPYVLVVTGCNSTHKARQLIAHSWPMFARGRRLGRTSKTAIII